MRIFKIKLLLRKDCENCIRLTEADILDRDYDKTKFHIDQKRGLANGLAALTATYRVGADKSVLRIALDLIDSANKDRLLWPL